MKSKIFPLLLFCVSVFIAGTAAFFSVKGIGLLFAGSFLPVVIMASSLEIGKLFAVSFLYRRWYQLPVLFKTYLTIAVVMLIGITSLGIFGFLSDAYQDTKNKITFLESKIDSIESQNTAINTQIKQTQTEQTTNKQQNNNTTDRYKKIYDDFVNQQTTTKQQLTDRLAGLDLEMQQVRDKPGGLFSNKKKDIEQMEIKQLPIREQINKQLLEIDASIKAEYDKFINKVDDLSNDQSDVKVDVTELYKQLEINSGDILELQNQIHNTDIGSFRFIADAFGVTVDDAVKWFTIIIVIVFDPLAMILMIGYNMYALNNGAVYGGYNTPPAGSRVIYKAKSK
jgi:hypothetical protein